MVNLDMPPSRIMTRPAIRNNTDTIDKHLKLLKDHTRLKNIYALFTESIQEYYKTSDG